MRIVASASHQLYADAIRFGLLLPRMRQADGHVGNGLRELRVDAGHGAQDPDAELLDHLLRGLLTPVLAQRMADLVAHHRRELGGRGPQLVDDPRTYGVLAA